MRAVAAFCEKWDMLPAGGLVLCAVSGGRDSMALLHLLLTMSEQGGFSVAAAHYNHRLRPTADRDEAFVRAWCVERNVPFYCGGGDVAAFAAAEGLSVEDAARRLRYTFLEGTAAKLGAERIATAHHLQDNAETVLLHLLRGSGLRGLTGIAPVRGRIIRPLLETERAAIDAYIEENRIPFVEDETNTDTRYTRNRLRLHLMPELEELAPGCAGRIAAAAALLREDEESLERAAAALLPPAEEDRVSVAGPLLQKQDPAVARRLVRLMARQLGGGLTREQTLAVLELKSGCCLDLGGGLQAVRKAHRLAILRLKPPLPPLVLGEGTQNWGPWCITVSRDRPAVPMSASLNPEKLAGPLTIAPWDGTGRLDVGNGRRTAKRLFADRGIPVEERFGYPALYMDGALIALPGVAADAAFAALEGDALWVSMERRREL